MAKEFIYRNLSNDCSLYCDIHEYKFNWTISDFNSYFKKSNRDNVVISESFLAGDMNDTKWYYVLLLNNHTRSEDYIGLFIFYAGFKYHRYVRASQTYYLLDNTGKKWRILDMPQKYFRGDSCKAGSYCIFNKQKLLQEAEVFFPDNELKIICHLRIINEIIFTGMSSIPTNSCLFGDMEKDFESEESKDLKLSLSGSTLKVHKDKLIARSPVFAAMFNHDMKENREKSVEILDVNPSVFHRMIFFIYTDKIINIDDYINAMELFVLADKYIVEDLRSMCAAIIKDEMNITNVGKILEFAKSYYDQDLMNYAEQFLKNNAINIMESPDYACWAEDHPELQEELSPRLKIRNALEKILETSK